MGQNPAKMFPPPVPYGASPTNQNLTQAMPIQQVSGPGFAAIDSYAPGMAAQPQQDASAQNPLMQRRAFGQIPSGGFGIRSMAGGLQQ